MWSLTYLIPEVMFAWAPVQRFLVATRARTDLPKARVLLYLVQLVWYVYSKKHLQEGGISNGKLWSCNHQIHSVPSAKKKHGGCFISFNIHASTFHLRTLSSLIRGFGVLCQTYPVFADQSISSSCAMPLPGQDGCDWGEEFSPDLGLVDPFLI